MSLIVENPRVGCALSGISITLGAMTKICPIYHSGPGCAMQNNASLGMQQIEMAGVLCPSTNMQEREVVFGGIKKLETTVRGAIEVYDADAYFILVGCTAGIIGDDVRSVVEKFQAEGYHVYATETPGFMGDANLGYESLWNTIIDQVIEETPTQENLVNIFGIIPEIDPYWRGNLEEITRLLNKLGVKVNSFFRDNQGYETLRTCSAAKLNIVINPWLFKGPGEKFEEKFGVPMLRIPGMPVGPTDTTAFLRKVGEALQLDPALVEKVVAEEEDYVYSYFESGIEALGWKCFGVVGDSNAAVGITRFLANDYSLTPGLVIISEPVFRPADKERIIKQLTELEHAKPPVVIFSADQYDINQAILEHPEISLLIGSANEKEAATYLKGIFREVTAPLASRLVFNRALAGYRGGLSLIEDLYSNL